MLKMHYFGLFLILLGIAALMYKNMSFWLDKGSIILIVTGSILVARSIQKNN